MIYNVKRKPDKRSRRRKKLLLFLLLVSLFLLPFHFYSNIRPLVSSIAESRVESVVMKAINDAAVKVITENAVGYDSMVAIERGTDGKVVSVTADSTAMNLLKSLLINEIVDNVAVYGTGSVKIPVGSIIMPTLFSGHGPEIAFDLMPVGSVLADFENEFDSAGINQTRHRINVKLTVAAGVYLPGYTTETTIETRIIIAESVIVGAVPESFVYIDNSKTTTEKDGLIVNEN